MNNIIKIFFSILILSSCNIGNKSTKNGNLNSVTNLFDKKVLRFKGYTCNDLLNNLDKFNCAVPATLDMEYFGGYCFYYADSASLFIRVDKPKHNIYNDNKKNWPLDSMRLEIIQEIYVLSNDSLILSTSEEDYDGALPKILHWNKLKCK